MKCFKEGKQHLLLAPQTKAVNMWVCHCTTADIKDCFLKRVQPEYCMFYVLRAFLSKRVFCSDIVKTVLVDNDVETTKKKTWMAGEMRGSFLPKVL